MICEECNRPNAELHHIIFRSAASYMVKVKSNFKYLCATCHRGNISPHKCIKKDLEYKLELQAKYYKMFANNYYTEKEIKVKLEISDHVLHNILKTLTVHKEGYEREELIRRLMGGKMYDTCD